MVPVAFHSLHRGCWKCHSGHNFTDALALGLAAFGFFLSAKPADESKTYGYQRAGVLAAFELSRALSMVMGAPKPIAMKAIAMHDATNLKNNGGKSLGCDQMNMSKPSPMKPNMDMKISMKRGCVPAK